VLTVAAAEPGGVGEVAAGVEGEVGEEEPQPRLFNIAHSCELARKAKARLAVWVQDWFKWRALKKSSGS
jgi:hypothetical protein